VRWRDVAGVHGGVSGVSDYTLFSQIADYEPESVVVVERLLEGKMRPVILDVGAHTGAWVFLFEAIRPAAIVHAFEPFPQLVTFLTALMRRNRWSDVHVAPVLVGAVSGVGELHFSPGATDCASIPPDFQPTYTDHLAIPRVTIDQYVDGHGIDNVALMKIDVEGGELEVLEGARRTLARWHPPLLMELLFTTNASHRRRQADAVRLLQAEGYAFYLIGGGGALAQQDVVEPDAKYEALNYLVTTATV
jgi:FkbM family methyltransferase